MLSLSAGGAKQAVANPCEHRVFEGDGFVVCSFDAQTQKLRLAWSASWRACFGTSCIAKTRSILMERCRACGRLHWAARIPATRWAVGRGHIPLTVLSSPRQSFDAEDISSHLISWAIKQP
jgi:hypothetical protein